MHFIPPGPQQHWRLNAKRREKACHRYRETAKTSSGLSWKRNLVSFQLHLGLLHSADAEDSLGEMSNKRASFLHIYTQLNTVLLNQFVWQVPVNERAVTPRKPWHIFVSIFIGTKVSFLFLIVFWYFASQCLVAKKYRIVLLKVTLVVSVMLNCFIHESKSEFTLNWMWFEANIYRRIFSQWDQKLIFG